MPYEDEIEHDDVTCVVFYPFLLSKPCVLLIAFKLINNEQIKSTRSECYQKKTHSTCVLQFPLPRSYAEGHLTNTTCKLSIAPCTGHVTNVMSWYLDKMRANKLIVAFMG